MNSLNIITARVSPPPSPGQSRSNSISSIGIGISPEDDSSRAHSDDRSSGHDIEPFPEDTFDQSRFDTEKPLADEGTPLLGDTGEISKRSSWWHSIPRRLASSIIGSIRWVLATLASPGVYLIACFYDEEGYFSPLTQLGKLFGLHRGAGHKKDMDDTPTESEKEEYGRTSGYRRLAPKPRPMSGSSTSSGLSSESESDGSRSGSLGRHARSKSLQPAEEATPTRRSIRIKLNSDEALRQRKHRKTQSAVARTKASDLGGGDLSAHLKSPTSPIAALTKYPKTPAPPRPLIPRRQPSYLNIEPSIKQQQKTLILDLDETLIHSMSKGGRMSTGHMVEVRLNTTYVGVGGQTSIGPQHPILYWVNKRPYCDEFLRRVCKWYNLVVFTASVQEYADPVIDWLEQERKFFSARFYRQHCTFRQGAFIKDLSSVESDLSNVMILDNSPLSYLFHQDNAIPIQGWINDPTDTDLMHLVPLLEGLQYVHDVRALLALRGGEDGQHMA
ncbi:nuclear envelope NEM1 [Fusarium albosuccineum]|uniref:Nuclear envelope NEM1 n=1 Tax=Fusarium albosuccineum TaxID=1237068 RepID=A0A8H4LH06_9HYPO|nr:nuclear envelope NEM1 [Fusarium albosuccineum]